MIFSAPSLPSFFLASPVVQDVVVLITTAFTVVRSESKVRLMGTPFERSGHPAVDASAHYVYGIEPRILPRRPGSGPMEELCLRYGLPVVNGAGVGYDGSRVHGPDEHIRLDDFLLNVKLIAVLLAEFAA